MQCSKTKSAELARLHAPAPDPLQVWISVRKVPTDDNFVLAAADDSARIELQLEHSVAAFAVHRAVVRLVVGLSMGVCVRVGCGLCVGLCGAVVRL